MFQYSMRNCLRVLHLLCFFPTIVCAQYDAVGTTHGSGVTVNGGSVPPVMAVFVGDVVGTGSTPAMINGRNASIVLDAGTTIMLLKDAFELEWGTISVVTHNGIPFTVGPILIKPASQIETKFFISDGGDSLRIQAQKGTLIVRDCSGETSLQEGEEGRRKKSRGCQKGRPPEHAATSGVLDSRTAIVGGMAIVSGITGWALLQSKSETPPPASPSAP